jgi:hypothetical protein
MLLFPSDDTPKSEKEKDTFGKQVLQAINAYNFGVAFWNCSSSNYARMALTEMYSDGSQPETQYKQQMHGVIGHDGDTKDPKTKGLVSYANISYRVFNPMPKLVSTIRQMLSGRDYRLEVESLDRTHVDEKIKAKYRLYTQVKITNPMRESYGLPKVQNRFSPQNEQDLELIDKLGFFKLELEGALEKVIEHSFDISDWRFIRQQFQKNLIDHRFRMAKICEHPVSGVPYIKWIDPKKVVIQWNPDNLGEKPLFVGHYESIQIRELADILLNEGYGKDEVENALKARVAIAYPNVNFNEAVDGVPSWYTYTTEVLSAEYISTDYTAFYTGKNKNGEVKTVDAVRDKDGNFKPNKFDEGRTIHVNTDNLYSGSIVVGTDFIYGWKRNEHQLRDKKNTVIYSYTWNYLRGRSMTTRVQGILDDLQMAVLKLRTAIAAASPKGYDIDLGDASNITVGNKKLDIYDLIKIKRETGITIRKRVKNADGSVDRLEPLNENEGGIGRQMNEWFSLIQMNIGLLFEELGIPAVMSGQTIASAEKAVGVVQQEVSGAVNAMFDEIEQEGIFKQKLGETILAYARVLIKKKKSVQKYYENLLGKGAVGALMGIEGYDIENLGIKLVSKPTEARKAMLLQECIELSKSGRDGFMAMTQADLIYVENLLANDQLELATIYMAKAVERNKQDHEAEQKRMIEFTAQQQQQSAAAANQMELQRLSLLNKMEIELLKAKTELEYATKSRLQAEKGAIEMEQIKTEIAAETTLDTNIRNPIS